LTTFKLYNKKGVSIRTILEGGYGYKKHILTHFFPKGDAREWWVLLLEMGERKQTFIGLILASKL
jgi:hypothetical protein